METAERTASGDERLVWHVAGREVLCLVPARRDPRLIEVGALAVALTAAHVLGLISASPAQIAVAVVTGATIDVALTYARQRVLAAPAGGAVTGLLVALVLQAPALLPFMLAAGLGVLAKHVIRYDGKHVFNPAAFGLAAVLLAFPGLTQAATSHWHLPIFLVPVLTGLGEVASQKAKTRNVAFWFIPTYVLTLVAGLTVAQWSGLAHNMASVNQGIGPTIAGVEPVFLIVAFYFITDPGTMPASASARRLYALVAAVGGATMSFSGMDHMEALLIALLVANAVALGAAKTWFAHEEPVPDDVKLVAPPRLVLRAIMTRVQDMFAARRNLNSVWEAEG